MKWIHGARARLRLLRRAEAERRMDEEIRFHIDMATEANLRAGMSPAEARRRARVAFGGVEGHREALRDGRTFPWTTGVSLDLRLGVRMLVKHRGLTLIGGFAMAVAIAIGAMAFEAAGEMLRSALPMDEGDRVVSIQYATDNTGNPERRVLHDFAAWRGELASVRELGAFRQMGRTLLRGAGEAEPVRVAEITASGFDLARTPPLLGRRLVPDDERRGAPPVVVIGHDVWRSRFAGDSGIVGRAINLGGTAHVVVGVMPRGFEFPLYHQFWTPLRIDPAEHRRLEGPSLYVFGRLAPGATLTEARAELATVARRTAAAHPGMYDRLRLVANPYPHEHLFVDDPVIKRTLWIARFLVGALLVIVAINLAILFYARTVARSGEITVRNALGASRRRILSQLFLEAFVLSVLGAAAGLLFAQLALGRIQAFTDRVERLPYWVDLNLSGATVVYALGLAVLAALIVGVLPGLKATGRGLQGSLRDLGGGTGARLGRTWTLLVVTQIAITVALLPLAGLLAWQVVRMELSGPGFAAGEIVVGTVELDEEAADVEGAALTARARARQLALVGRLESEPGVSAVALSSRVPMIEEERRIQLEGEPGVAPEVGMIRVSPELFAAYEARILAGRALHAGDGGGTARRVVVSRNFVERVLGNGAALGRRFAYADEPAVAYEIVGVVSDFPAFAPPPVGDAEARVYHPLAPGDLNQVTVSIRLRGGIPDGFARRVREIGAGIDPALELRGLQPLDEFYQEQRSFWRYIAWGFSLLTGSVLLLSAAGIYSMMSFTVAQRTREIGIRAALGAPARRILVGIFARVMRQLAIGVCAGSLLSGVLFARAGLGVGKAVVLFAAVAAVMSLVGMVAAFGPARRTLRIQPVEALRAG
jgi:predicted permease